MVCDSVWWRRLYGNGRLWNLATVNAVYALNGQYMDVMELANYAVEKNYRIVGSGTDDGIFKAAAKKYGQKYGFAWDGASGSIDVLKKKLKAAIPPLSMCRDIMFPFPIIIKRRRNTFY